MTKTNNNAAANNRNSDPVMVTLRTWECGSMLERSVPRVFAMAQLGRGYDKVQVINPEWDTIEAEG
jgi:hypothetical protein